MLTPEQITQIRAQAGVPATPSNTPMGNVKPLSQRLGLSTPTAPVQMDAATSLNKDTTQLAKNYGNEVGGAFNSSIDYAKSGYNEAAHAKNPWELIQGSTKLAAGGIGSLFSPLAPIGNHIVSPVVNAAADKISDIPAVQKFAMSPAGETTSSVVGTVGDVANIAGAVAGVGNPTESLSNVKGIANNITDKTGELVGKGQDLLAKSPERLAAESDHKIVNSFNKGIKPSVAGKGTASQVTKFNSKVLDAVKTITQNKTGLNITDEFGDATGSLPKSPRELSQAIEQTKQQVFNQYDALTKAAGEKGFSLQLKPVATELEKIASNPVINDLHPELAAYAKQRAATLSDRAIYSPAQAQTAIQNLNKSLESFYKNPSYETASKASVDAMIANNLNKGLDDVIEGASPEAAAARKEMGESTYKELKAKYGALKTIEKDVNRRAQVLARKTTGGLSFGDVFSAEQVIHGITSMNPAAILAGAGIKGTISLWKYLNNPDRYIKKMFNEAENTTSMGKSAPSPTNAPALLK